MAKSARASSKKANHTKLRARVFGPAEKLRAERIHAKLLETINQPKPSEQAKTDAAEETTTEATKDDLSKDMEVDGAADAAAATAKKSSSKDKDKSQTRKQLRRRPQNKVSFPTSRGKGALKPYAGSRVGKKRS